MIDDRVYRIAFKGLKTGLHQFQFHIGTDFLASREGSSLRSGDFEVTVHMDKRDAMMVLDFVVSGYFDAPCDRCLSAIQVPVEFTEQIVVQFDENERDEDDIIYVDPKRNYLFLGNILYELIHVNRPVRNVRDCEREKRKFCDLAVLSRLEVDASRDKDDDMWNPLQSIKI